MNKVVGAVAFFVLLYSFVSLYRIIGSSAPDFSVFYDAARGLVSHQNIYTLHMFTGLGYPPFTLVPFIPFTLLPYHTAQLLWVLISFVLFLLCIYVSLRLVYKKVTPVNFCVVFILAFLAFPTKFTFGMGQVNFVALLLLLLALRYQSGIFLGLLFLIKPHFLLLLPLFSISMIGFGFGVLGAGVFFTGVLYGWNQYVYYFRVVVPPLLAFAGRELYYNQSMGSFFARIFPQTFAGQLTFFITPLLILFGLWRVWSKKLSLRDAVFFFLPIFLLVEPLSWQHHYVFLLPVFVWLSRKAEYMWVLMVSYVLIATNISDAPALLLSHVFVGNLILLGLATYETA